MDDTSETRKLNAIVGAAIKSLVESGAGDEFVGSFAMSHRAKVAKILDAAEPESDGPDLLTVVTQAVKLALEQAGVTRSKESGTKRVNVEVAGRRTSVTLSKIALDQLVKSKGSTQQAKTVVQDLANTAPANVENRSAWIEERLLGLLAFTNQVEPPAQRH